MFLVLLIALAAFGILYLIVNSQLPGLWKFGLGILEMFIIGQILIRRYNFKGDYSIIMLRTKKGLQLISYLAKKEEFWKFFADVGLVISYGALSLILMRKQLTWKSILVGFALLILISMFVVPLVVPFLAANIQGVVPVKSSSGAVSSLSSFISSFGLLVLLGGGFFAILLLGLLFYGGVVFYAIFSTLFLGTSAIANTSPGATLLLPGVNLPLVEGILALLIILIVHEGAHAVLGRIAKVPILSSGIVLFGVIPIGAFVEPDEEFLKKVERVKQTRVIVAGSTANLITSIIFFVLFVGFIFASVPYRETGWLVIKGPANGSIIYTINGQEASLFANTTLPINSDVVLGTNKGEIIVKSNSEGKIGIEYYSLSDSLLLAKFKEGYLNFIYMFLGLTFSLNFVIGSINMLPLPFFDGYRIMELNIKNKKIVDALMYVTLAGFILNLLPHLF